VTDVALAELAYPARLDALRDAGVGLWDVVRTATRIGSLDARIREPTTNPLGALAASLPELRAIAFNGGKASALGRKQIGGCTTRALLTLPSSSPAHTLPFADKAAEWVRLRPYLEDHGSPPAIS
jgi:hypoxanthine-DNA glycosylase